MTDWSAIYEKLGVFYLGKGFDVTTRQLSSDLVLYESKDLVTHAVCVGMTGSGKTGLGMTLLEEAAIDGIPSLVVDPKGDMTNLLLNFPSLAPSDFVPWVNPDDASREGLSVDEYAARQATQWKNGLADWHQNVDRVSRLGASCDFNIFTPGSDAGKSISIVSSFAVPPAAVLADLDLLRDRVSTTATSLLAMVGIQADPIRSREHILLTTIFDHCWRNKVSLDLGSLIQMVQEPPVTQVGVMDLGSFFPPKDRFALAMVLNNLLAAPGFAVWMSGEPLDVDRLLYAEDGRPRVSVLYLAHLSDAERMFFVSLLLNQVIGWMRGKPGTTSLRALLYFDELFGYMPPVADPPSKRPLLTLLKQARAYGLGLVLATQNPVDLDYKGLSNAGTWFLGRLQTDRDKQRVLDGLEGASADSGGNFDRTDCNEILSALGKRVFLMHNVHEARPQVFQTRWALSYLAGPMTRAQIKRLMDPKKASSANAQDEARGMAAAKAGHVQRYVGGLDVVEHVAPVLPPDIPQVHLPLRRAPGAGEVIYEPRLVAVGKVHYVDTRKSLSAEEDMALLTLLDASAFGVKWSDAVRVNLQMNELLQIPARPGSYRTLPAAATIAKNYTVWRKELEEHIYREYRFPLLYAKMVGEYSLPGEGEREFRVRLRDRSHEQRDAMLARLREKYATRITAAEDRVRRAEGRLEREREQAAQVRTQSWISTSAAVLSVILGRRKLTSTNVGRATTAARGHGRAQAREDQVRRADRDVSLQEEKLEDLQADLEREVKQLEKQYDVSALEITRYLLKPRKSDIAIRHVALAWAPFTTDAAGQQVPLF